MAQLTLGCIGQGFVGKNIADDLEARGYTVVRYALEPAYVANKDKIGECDIVFIAVPTPSTPSGFDFSIVRESLGLLKAGAIAVIKSTVLPGTTETLQEEFPEQKVLFSPEFLRERSARDDVSTPERSIVGIPVDDHDYREAALAVLAVMPEAPYQAVLSAREAELVKYAGNCFLATKVIFMNMVYELAEKLGADYERVRDAVVHDSRIGESHTQVDFEGGRGAGGHCFIKDFAAFRELAERELDHEAVAALRALEEKNIALLARTGKSVDLLCGVYGEEKVAEALGVDNVATKDKM